MSSHKRQFKTMRTGLILLVIIMQIVAATALPARAISTDTGNTGGSFDPGKVSWLDTVTCLFSDLASIPGGIIGGVSGGALGFSVGDCGKLMADKVAKQIQDFGGWINKPLDTVFDWMLTIIANISKAVSMLEVTVIVIFANPNVFKFATAPFVHAGWYVTLQIANMLIVLGLIILANKFILGMEKFGDFKALQEYVIAALFLNFSLTIASFFIGVSNFLTLTFLNLTGQPTSVNPAWDIPRNFGDRLGIIFEDLGKWNEIVGGLSGLASVFVGVILSLCIMIILAAIAFSFVKRVLLFWAYLILMPLAYVIGKLGTVKDALGSFGGGDAWRTWMKNFTKELVFGPVMAFFLWLTLFIIANISNAYTNIGTVALETDTAQRLQYLLEPLIFIGLLAFGLKTANEAAGYGFAWAERAVKKVSQDMPRAVGRWAGAEVKKPVSNLGASVAQAEWFKNMKETLANANRTPVIGGLFGRMSTAMESVGSKAKEDLKRRAELRYLAHNLKGMNNAGAVLKLIENARAGGDMELAAAGAKRFMEMKEGGYEGLLHSSVTEELRTIVETSAKDAGIEYKEENLHKLKPSRAKPEDIPDLVESMTDSDIRKAAKIDIENGSTSELKVIAKNATSNTQFMSAMRAYRGASNYKTATRELTADINPDVIASLNKEQITELLTRKRADEGFQDKIIEIVRDRKDQKFRQDLWKIPALQGHLSRRIRISGRAGSVKDAETYFTG